MKRGINLVIPHTMRTSHNIEVVEITPGKGSHHVVAPRNQDQISVVDSNRFIESRIVVHTLKGESIGRLNVMVIGLLKVSCVASP
jgi:hypothetical protein